MLNSCNYFNFINCILLNAIIDFDGALNFGRSGDYLEEDTAGFQV